MYKKKLWKPIIAGTLALAMALTPLGSASIVSAAEPTETSNKVNAELTTTDDVTDVTTEDNTEAATESDSADSSSSIKCSEDTTEDMDAESTDAVDETATEESEKAEIPESIQEEESGINTAENIPLTAAYFPDANFRKYISENVDTNKDNVLSQAERDACTAINIYWDNVDGPVNSLNGIEFFSKLEDFIYLRIDYGNDKDPINQIDLSKNTDLTHICISNTCIKSLDISKNTKLTSLWLEGNSLTSLNLGKNTELTELDCSDNQIKVLDVRNNTKLTRLDTDCNPLNSIDVSNNQQLKIFSCSGVSSIDISNNPELTSLIIVNSKIKSLDVSKNPKLSVLTCSYNLLPFIDLDSNPNKQNITLNSTGNTYPVRFNSKNQFDLSIIPDFQLSKVSNLQGGSINGTILTLNKGTDKVTYTYDCGGGHSSTFTIKNSDQEYTQTEAFCSRLYTLCLGRTADQAGIDYWSLELESYRMTGSEVGYSFVFSDEYKKKNTSDEAYVKMLYKVFMDREADQGGLNYWLDLLNQGMSREYVYKGFAESQEFTKICTSYGIERGTVKLTQARDQNVNLTKFVNRIYVKAMNRTGEANGLNYWCSQIQSKKMTPVQVAESFIYSKEFTDKNLSNTEYIKVLYRTFMGREADTAGLNYWLGRLNKGDSRKTVLKAFAGCQEFKNIVKSFGL